MVIGRDIFFATPWPVCGRLKRGLTPIETDVTDLTDRE
jgi:hypothetical protein